MKKHFINEVNIISFISSCIGAILMTFYVFNASIDVVVSDYMRIINYYYDNVFELHYLLSISAINRSPICFLMRIINACVFNLSVNFDRVISIIFLFLFNFVLVKYVLNKINKRHIRIIASVVLTIISFSLSQWEMILNGTAYPHYMTLFMIIITFYYFDKYFYNEKVDNNSKLINSNYIIIMLLILITSLIFAGSYGIGFCLSFITISLILIIYNFFNNKKLFKYNINYYLIIFTSVICIVLYFLSVKFDEPYTISGAEDITLIELLKNNPLFSINFLIKSFASSMVSFNVFEFYKYLLNVSDSSIYFYGITYILFVIIFLLLFIFNKSYKNYIFIIMMFIFGSIDYVLIFLSRYVFVRDTYGMSSRYYIQYMFLLISIISYCFIMIDKFDKNVDKNRIIYFRYKFSYMISIIFVIYILSCQYITIKHEIFLMPNRKVAYAKAKDVILNVDEYEETEIKNSLEYQRDIDTIKNAINIIKSHKYNVFN